MGKTFRRAEKIDADGKKYQKNASHGHSHKKKERMPSEDFRYPAKLSGQDAYIVLNDIEDDTYL